MYQFFDCQSNTFLLMNVIISDISKLTIKIPEQFFYCWLGLDFTLNLEDLNNSWGAT